MTRFSENNINDLVVAMRQNHNAVAFLDDLLRVLHLWDDLYDQDKTLSPGEISSAFRLALVDIPRNPFYETFRQELVPLIMNVILQWQDANALETGPERTDHDLHMAYMLRAGYYQIVNYCAYLVGGPLWAESIGPRLRRLYGEKLEAYMEEMKNA
jgi:hypothetical protein